MLKNRLCCAAFFACIIFCVTTSAVKLHYNTGSLTEDVILEQAKGLRPAVLEYALKAYNVAWNKRLPILNHHLIIIDYSLPSTEKRLWVLDMERNKISQQLLVTHGVNSGDTYPTRFSNKNDSHQSSLGLYLTGAAYQGNDGYSMKLKGLESHFNSNAERRTIVIHSDWYATSASIKNHGRLGKSWGCPVVSPEAIDQLIDTTKDGSLLFAYYPDKQWLSHSKFL